MGTLDAVVDDVTSKFGLGSNEASSLLSGILSLFNEQSGGVSGFLDRFRQAGLGNTVSSWLGGDARAISADQLESVVGRTTLSSIASRAGLSLSTAVAAIAFMLPKVIQRLAPGGLIPSKLPADIASYASRATEAVSSGARQAAYAAERSGIGRYIVPLLALLGAVLLAMWVWNNRGSVRSGVFDAESQIRAATERASAAIAGLRPGYSGAELVGALNQYVINFAPGGAEIPAYSRDFLGRAAQFIRSAPAGTVIEIGGHTDNTGDSNANRELSQRRAEAVREYLIQQGVTPETLVARGYGSDNPVAANDSDQGRFRNRRIEFTVLM